MGKEKSTSSLADAVRTQYTKAGYSKKDFPDSYNKRFAFDTIVNTISHGLVPVSRVYPWGATRMSMPRSGAKGRGPAWKGEGKYGRGRKKHYKTEEELSKTTDPEPLTLSDDDEEVAENLATGSNKRNGDHLYKEETSKHQKSDHDVESSGVGQVC